MKSKQETRLIRLGCGCNMEKTKIEEQFEQVVRLDQPMQIVCTVRPKECRYMLAPQEILKAVGAVRFKKTMEHDAVCAEARCLLCKEGKAVIKLHRDHAICEDCLADYKSYCIRKGRAKGARLPCPANACRCWFFPELQSSTQ